jgi:hypothetical protein
VIEASETICLVSLSCAESVTFTSCTAFLVSS